MESVPTISLQQIDWLIVYGPLTSCKNKSEKSTISFPGHLTFFMLVPCYCPSKTVQWNVLISLDEF